MTRLVVAFLLGVALVCGLAYVRDRKMREAVRAWQADADLARLERDGLAERKRLLADSLADATRRLGQLRQDRVVLVRQTDTLLLAVADESLRDSLAAAIAAERANADSVAASYEGQIAALTAYRLGADSLISHQVRLLATADSLLRSCAPNPVRRWGIGPMVGLGLDGRVRIGVGLGLRF